MVEDGDTRVLASAHLDRESDSSAGSSAEALTLHRSSKSTEGQHLEWRDGIEPRKLVKKKERT